MMSGPCGARSRETIRSASRHVSQRSRECIAQEPLARQSRPATLPTACWLQDFICVAGTALPKPGIRRYGTAKPNAACPARRVELRVSSASVARSRRLPVHLYADRPRTRDGWLSAQGRGGHPASAHAGTSTTLIGFTSFHRPSCSAVVRGRCSQPKTVFTRMSSPLWFHSVPGFVMQEKFPALSPPSYGVARCSRR